LWYKSGKVYSVWTYCFLAYDSNSASHFDHKERQNLIKDFDESDFIILTSPNAVEHFMKTILGLKAANVILQKIFVVIGRSTAQY